MTKKYKIYKYFILLQDYKCTLKNDCGEETFEFKFFVTVEGGMDFRAMLIKKKKPAKKVAVLEYEWLETPVDVTVQEGKVEQITFSARLSEKDKKGKWFLRNEETLKSNLALEHGVVCLPLSLTQCLKITQKVAFKPFYNFASETS